MYQGMLYVILWSLLYLQAHAIILIIIPVYNRPDFIELQHKCFGKFLKDDYELMIFNDASDPQKERAIAQTCLSLGITCVRVPQTIHNVDPECIRAPASYRHGEVLQFAFDHYGYAHNDIVTIFDSDVFLIHEFSIRNYLGDCAVNAIGAWRDSPPVFNYGLLVHFAALNIPKLEDVRTLGFRAGVMKEPGHDFYAYHLAHQDLKIRSTLNYVCSIQQKHLCEALNLDPAREMTDQLQSKGYTAIEISLIQSLQRALDQLKPGDQGDFAMDCNIGFSETNLLLDYQHGSSWHGPNAKALAIKDKIFKEFMRCILSE